VVCLEDTEAVVGSEKVMSKWLDGRSGTECTLTSKMLLSKLVGSKSSTYVAMIMSRGVNKLTYSKTKPQNWLEEELPVNELHSISGKLKSPRIINLSEMLDKFVKRVS